MTAAGTAAAPRPAGGAPLEGRRRLLHVASGCCGPLAALLRPSLAAGLFGALLLVAAGLETARLRSPRARALLDRLAGGAFRPSEARAVSGATALAAGYALVWWLFPARVAVAAILVAAVGDPAAALVGSRAAQGRSKSWAGSAACACAAVLVLLLVGTRPAVALVAAAVAAAAERAPWGAADNLTVPLATGVALWALA